MEVGHDVLAFSAFWDERDNDFDNAKAGRLVRVMAIVAGPARPEIRCLWSGDGADNPYLEGDTEGVQASPVKYYEMCENHGRPWGSFVLSCEVPDYLTTPPCHVTLMTVDRATHRVPIRTLKPALAADKMSQFTVCVPPLFGEVSSARLVEFIEVRVNTGRQFFLFFLSKVNRKKLRR